MKHLIAIVLFVGILFGTNTSAATSKKIASKKKSSPSRKLAQANTWPTTNCKIYVEKQNKAGEFKQKIVYLYAKSKKRCDEQLVIQKNAHEAWIGKDISARNEYNESK